jgi:methyltransferase (TIGR00027 family)
MKAGFPSMTARSAAAHRAVHQLVDFPHVYDDPLAVEIVGLADLALMIEFAAAFLPGFREMRAFVAARSRYTEDQLAGAIPAGTGQYVILGAGLDTFAYRHCYSKRELKVFEVDHPDTQAWKRRRLADAAIPVPSEVRFVPFDFERQGLDIELIKAGLRLGEPAFFSLLGVTPYLANDIVMPIFALIHALCPKNTVVFDYLAPRQTLSAWERMAFDVLSEEVERGGEPFRGFFLPEALIRGMKRIGFQRIENPTKDQLNACYFRDRLDALLLQGDLHGLMRAN